MKLSVIVPVYNCEGYLKKCLESIIHQDFKEEYEVIIINDGSTDQSQNIIDHYVQEYPNLVKTFYKENGGLSSARNFGLEYAQGEYLSFVDSDDWLDLDYYTKGISTADEKDYSIVVFDMIDHYPNYDVHHFCSQFENRFKMTMSAANKLFRKDAIGEKRFANGLWYEDLEFTTTILLLNDNIGGVDNACYHCHCREESIMTNDNSPKNLDILTIFDLIQENAKTHGIYFQYKEVFNFMILDHILITSINRVSKQNHPEKEEVVKKLRQYVRDNIPNINNELKKLGFPRNRRCIAKLNNCGLHHLSQKLLKLSSTIKRK